MARLDIEIINNDLSREETIPLKGIINSPIERLKYTRYQKNNEVNIAYVESKEITSLDNLYILERHWEKPENNTSLLEDFEFLNIYNKKVFYSEYKKLLITDKVYIDRHGEERPLFYRHKMKASPIETKFYYIENKIKTPVEEGYSISDSDNELYTNYQNYFDYRTGSYRLFFVNYTDSNGNSYNELLNPEPAINEISEESLDIDGNIIKDSYSSEKENSRYKFEIFLKESLSARKCSSENGFYIKPLEANEIKILPPESIYLDNPWYLRITNGEFVSGENTYSTPEYLFQEFTNEFGVIRLVDKDSYYVTDKVIKLPVEQIKHDNEEEFYIDVILMDEEENVLRAITTDPSKAGKRYQNTNKVFENDLIVSVDENKGFVELSDSINKTNIIKCSFFYRTNETYYSMIDFNPVNNRKLLDHKYVIYVKPNIGATQRAIHYLLLDRENIIVETSDPEFKLYVNGNDINENTSIRKELSVFESENPNFLFLGEVSVIENSKPKDLFIFDIKSNLLVDEDNIDTSIHRNFNLLQSEFMYGEEGQKIQRNNIASIDVPYDLLSEYSEDEIKGFLNNKIPISTNYIVNFTYPKSTLTLSTDANDNVVIKMSWEGKHTYKLYRNSRIEGEYITPIYTVNSDSRPNEDVLEFTDIIPQENQTQDNVYYYTVKIDDYPIGNIYGIKRI